MTTSDYYLRWCEEHLDIRRHGATEVDVLCPVHGDRNPSMRVNITSGLFICHACGVCGSLGKLARHMGVEYYGDGINDNDIDVELSSAMRALSQSIRDSTAGKTRATMDEDALRRYNNPLDWWTQPISDGGRGFTSSVVHQFGLGYDPLSNVAVIPVRYADGVLAGITRRFMDPGIGPRYKDAFGFDKAGNLFGSWIVHMTAAPKVLVVVEGPLDAVAVWSAGYPAVAQYGSSLTDNQKLLIERLGPESVVLMYDNDKAGQKATLSAIGINRRLDVKGNVYMRYDEARDISHGNDVYAVAYHKHMGGADPGSLEHKDIRELIETAPRVRGVVEHQKLQEQA